MQTIEIVKQDIIDEQKRIIDNAINELNVVKAENYNLKLEIKRLKDQLNENRK